MSITQRPIAGSSQLSHVEPDKTHPCGCVTFWTYPRDRWGRPKCYYRAACALHRTYVGRLGILVA